MFYTEEQKNKVREDGFKTFLPYDIKFYRTQDWYPNHEVIVKSVLYTDPDTKSKKELHACIAKYNPPLITMSSHAENKVKTGCILQIR